MSSWQLGFLGDAPLNDSVSLYANCNVVLPGSSTGPVGSNELLWDCGVGVMVSLGAKSQAPTVSGRAGMPLLPVANNGSFLIGN